jgi:predicted phage terminase large subunit-like protein
VTYSKSSDFYGFVVSKVTEGNFVYILEAAQKKFSPEDAIREIFKYLDMFHVSTVLLETVAAQRLFLLPLKQEMRTRNKFFKIDEVNAGTKESKPARIRGLIPHYANGRIFHRKGLSDLETQLLEFPRNTHDDIIDALSFQIPYWNGPSASKPKVTDPYMSLNWWKKQVRKPNNAVEELFKDFKRG